MFNFLRKNKVSESQLNLICMEIGRAFHIAARLNQYICDENLGGAGSAALNEPLSTFTVGAQSMGKYSVAQFPVASSVDPATPVGEFLIHLAKGFSSWAELSKKTGPSLNKRRFGHDVEDALFKNNPAGWQNYRDRMILQGFENFGA
jgi:hypothetical protein